MASKYNPEYKYKINPAWVEAPYAIETTCEIEDVVVEASFTAFFYKQNGWQKIRNILETKYKFLAGIPIDEQYDPTGKTVTFRQKQRRIKQQHLPKGGDSKIPYFDGDTKPGDIRMTASELEAMKAKFEAMQEISYKDMMPDFDDSNYNFETMQKFLDEYLKYQHNKENKENKKEDTKSKNQSAPLPKPPEVYPLNIFSVEDLNDSK